MNKERLKKLWLELIEKGASNDKLREVISDILPLREAACQKLREQGSDNNDNLMYLIKYEDDPLKKERDAARLLRQNPEKDNLKCIIKYITEERSKKVRMEAAYQLIKIARSSHNIRYVIYYVESLKETFGRILMEEYPTEDNLVFIVDHVDALREDALSKLIGEEVFLNSPYKIARHFNLIREHVKRSAKRSKKEILEEMRSLVKK